MTASDSAPRNSTPEECGAQRVASVFERFTGLQDWPQEIDHLKGKRLRRKRDGGIYRIRFPSGQDVGGKPAAYLEPAGCDWTARSHWKTHAKILTDFEVMQ